MARQGKANQVRIIGGAYRRRMLSFPDQAGLRPTPDRVRETVFNWLGQTLEGLSVLDLFAGSGAMGLEAASRGAKVVTLVEKAAPVAAALRANCRVLGTNEVTVVEADAVAWSARCQTQFDVVFLDPPFAANLLPTVLPLLPAVLSERGVVYMESDADITAQGWRQIKSGKAGLVRYGLWEWGAEA